MLDWTDGSELSEESTESIDISNEDAVDVAREVELFSASLEPNGCEQNSTEISDDILGIIDDEGICEDLVDADTSLLADDTSESNDESEEVDISEISQQNPSNTVVSYFGQKYRTDDNGDIYMRYNDQDKNWELMPDTKYKSNGYYYETNEEASITRAGGTIRENTEGRKPLNAELSGMQDGDDRGHIIGDQYDGSNKIDNLFPQASTINRGTYKTFENTIAKMRDEGHDIQEVIDLVYSSDAKRPDRVDVRMNIDGYYMDETFDNGVTE